MEFDVERSIAAPADRLFRILTDAADYGSWDNGMRIEGQIVEGEQITVHLASPGHTFSTTVDRLVPHELMVWKSSKRLGLFTRTRNFELTERPDGTTDFRMFEIFEGLQASRHTRDLPDLQPSFEQFADGLKRHAESTAR